VTCVRGRVWEPVSDHSLLSQARHAGSGNKFDAFLSYDKADAELAEALQSGLQGLFRHPMRLRPYMRVFRDRTDLRPSAASLGEKIQRALLSSDHLVVILSPSSAKSRWVDHEIAMWLDQVDPDGERLVPVVARTTGPIENLGAFDWTGPDVPPALRPVFAQSPPLAVDMRELEAAGSSRLSLHDDDFRSSVVSVASAVRQIEPIQLDGELRSMRRSANIFRTLVAMAVVGVVLAAGIASIFGSRASTSAREAADARSEVAGISAQLDRAQTELAEAEQARESALEAQAVAQEASRRAEAAAELAEEQRADAEALREEAEKAADAAETSRREAEADQRTAQALQGEAEDARKAAERLAAAAEEAAEAAEEARAASDEAAEAAEEARADSDEQRVRAEDAQEEAERLAAEAEAARSGAEERQSAAERAQRAAEASRTEAEAARSGAEERPMRPKLLGPVPKNASRLRNARSVPRRHLLRKPSVWLRRLRLLGLVPRSASRLRSGRSVRRKFPSLRRSV